MVELYNDDCFNVLERFVSEEVKVGTVIVGPPYNIEYVDWDCDFNLFRH